MAKKFNNLIEKMSQESRKRISKKKEELYTGLALQELRQALQLTQQQLAGTLKLNQAAISKIEHQSDMYVSTLRRFLNAMGGELRIIAHFPQGDVVINQFEEISRGKGAPARA
jgi:transcriptional regulator with XRE-family HTH domain